MLRGSLARRALGSLKTDYRSRYRRLRQVRAPRLGYALSERHVRRSLTQLDTFVAKNRVYDITTDDRTEWETFFHRAGGEAFGKLRRRMGSLRSRNPICS